MASLTKTETEQMYSGKDFGDALLRRDISIAQFARTIGLAANIVGKWPHSGVPIKHQAAVRENLNRTKYLIHDGHHQDFFPETIRGEL